MTEFWPVRMLESTHPKARRYLHVLSLKRELFDRKGSPQPLGQICDVPHRNVRDNQNELIPGQPPADVRRARVFLENRRKSLEYFIARQVTVLVVHHLELIQIRQHHPQRKPVSDSPSQLLSRIFLNRSPIRQTRKEICPRRRFEQVVLFLNLAVHLNDSAAHTNPGH